MLKHRAASNEVVTTTFALCMVVVVETPTWLLYEPSTPKQRAILLLKHRVMKKHQELLKALLTDLSFEELLQLVKERYQQELQNKYEAWAFIRENNLDEEFLLWKPDTEVVV